MSPLLYLSLLISASTSLPILPRLTINNRASLAECVLAASTKFFLQNTTIIFSMSPPSVDPSSWFALNQILLKKISDNAHWSLIIKNAALFEHADLNFPPMNYIIQVHNESEFWANIKTLESHLRWNPNAKFMVISATHFHRPETVAKSILRSLFRVDVNDGVVLLPNPANRTQFDVYTWYPYRDGSCGDNTTALVVIDQCNYGVMSTKVPWFGDRLSKNFKRCNVNVRTTLWPPYVLDMENGTQSTTDEYTTLLGYEIKLVNLIAWYFNLTMLYYTSLDALSLGDVYPNGTATGNLKSLKDKEVDIAVGGYTVSSERSQLLDTLTYAQDSLHWCVPYIVIDTHLERLYYLVPRSTALATLLIYATIAGLVSVCSCTEERTSLRGTSGWLEMYRIILGVAVLCLPRTDRVRFFVTLLLFYSFYFITAYTTLMTSVLARTRETQKYNTIEDVLRDDNLSIIGIDAQRKYFEASGNPVHEKILSKWVKCEDSIEVCLEQVAFQKDSVMLLPDSLNQFILNSFIDTNKDPLIYCFKEPMTVYLVSVLMRKGFPLTQQMNELWMRIQTTGIQILWKRQIFWYRFENVTRNLEAKDTTNHDFNNIRYMFIVLWVGCGLSVGGFVAELVVYKWLQRQRK